MIKIRTKANFLFIIIVIVLTIITIVGFMCCEHKPKRIIETDKQPIEKTIEEDNITIEIETDKDGDTNQAVEPVSLGNFKSDEPYNKIHAKEEFFYLSDYERWVAECIVMGESGGEPYDGQMAVAQCILNACLKDGLKPSEVRKKYKYSGWNDKPTQSVKTAVSSVFDVGDKITDKFILYFYAPKYVDSKWHETQCFVMQIGGHRFFSEWEVDK